MNARVLALASGPIAALLALSSFAGESPMPNAAAAIVLENDLLRLGVGADGRTVAFADKRSGKDYCPKEPRQAFAAIRRQGKTVEASACAFADGTLTVKFGDTGVTAVLKVTAKKHYLVLDVVSVSDPSVEELLFGSFRAALPKHVSGISGVASGEDFAACVRALNLQTNLGIHGGPTPLFLPTCYAKYGLAGAKAAIVGCPTAQLRSVLQEVVREEGLPCSPLGGPFALDAEENRGSYVFATVSEKNADEWIALAKKAGLAEIHLISWEKSLGHYEPRKDLFPNGLDGLKSVVAKIHAAGLRAGMHTLTGCIATNDPFATPVPDKRFAKDASFTLAEPLDEKAKTLPTTEAPKDLDTMWAYGSRGNVLQIDDELIQYSGLSAAPPGFTGLTRGAFGTKASAHPKGAAAHHLYVRYTSFQPDENTTLVDDVAACIARVFNACEFDMIYMDGAEGMAGGWHGVGKMREAIFRRLNRRALVEASEWGYHSWPFHSRIGAYDHPNWALKRFVDIHCADTDNYRASSLLAAQLGWWAILGPNDDHPAEFPDEVEYLCAKSLAMDAPMSFQGIDAGPRPWNARQSEYLELIGRYERLRLARAVPDALRARLRTPREEFRLADSPDGKPQFIPTDYLAHKVTSLKDGSAAWTVQNRYGPQPLKLRIEALYAAAPYDSKDSVVLAAFDKYEFTEGRTAPGVSQALPDLAHVATPEGFTGSCGAFEAKSTLASPKGAWARLTRTFTPPLDLRKHGALGVWIQGDGKGELLNFQLTNPPQFWPTWDEHYVDVGFTGWRYFELLLRERDADRHWDYVWPYGGLCDVTRSPLIRDHVSALSIYYNNLPPNDAVKCSIGAIKALPIAKVKLANPTVSLGDRKIVFPVQLESGQYIELESAADCRLYDERGALLGRLTPQGDVPRLAAGENAVRFACGEPQGYGARAKVTIITMGEPLAER